LAPARLRVRLRRLGRDLRPGHDPRGDLRPPGIRRAAASASRNAFVTGSGFSCPVVASCSRTGRGFRGPVSSAGRWRHGVLDGIDCGATGVLRVDCGAADVGGVLCRVLNVFRCVLGGSAGYGRCRTVDRSGGRERNWRLVAASRHARAGCFRAQRTRT
jgi:hypothetical protein